MPKAPAKKSAAKKAVPPAAVKAALSTEPAPPADETTDETVQREAPLMQAADEPTDFDNLVDCARVVDKTFGSEMPKEGTNNFMLRLLTAISNTTTEQFDSLSLSAQTWYENGCQEGNDKKDITPPTGYVKPEVAAKATVTKKAAGEKKAAVVKKEKAAKAPKAPKEPKAPCVVATVRRLIIQNSTKNQDDIRAILAAQNITCKPTTFLATWTDTQQSIRIVKEEGHWH